MTDELSKDQQRAGMRIIYLSQAIGPLLILLLTRSAFGVLFIKCLGGSDFQAMLLGSLLVLSRVVQLPVSLMVPPAVGKRFMILCWTLNGLLVTCAVGITLLQMDAALKVNLVVLLIGVGSVIHVAGGAFWFPILHDLVPGNERGRFLGKMRAVWNASLFVAVLIIGVFMGDDSALWKFRVVLVIVVGLFLARGLLIIRLPEVRRESDDDHRNWKKYLRQIFARREVVILCAYSFLLGCCAGFLGMPVVLYMSRMGFSVSNNMIVFGFGTLGSVLALLLAGELVDRAGTKRVFAIVHIALCGVSFALVGIGWLGMPAATYLMPLARTICGGVVAMAGVACTAQLFHFAPDRGRAFFMSLAMMVVTGGAAISPIVAGWLSESVPVTWSVSFLGQRWDIFQVMFGGAGVATLALLGLFVFLEEAGGEEHGSSCAQEGTA